MSVGERLRRAFLTRATRRPLRWFAEPTYEACVRVELGVARARDLARGPCRAPLDDVTAVIKTFERPNAVRRLHESIRRVYPELRVVVADDSAEPVALDDDRCRLVRLPYDSGTPAGRNAGLAAVETDLFLLLDDDFIVTSDTGLERAVTAMREHPELDIVGGEVLTLPTFRRDVHPDNRDIFGGVPGRPATIGGLPLYDRVSNFFVGRTKRVASIGWDENLKRLDHSDFFRSAHGKLLVAFDARFRCLHAMTPFDDAYMAHRRDVGGDLAYLAGKWSRTK